MNLSQSYVEMVTNGTNRPADEGARSYPAAALEIMLLDHAQQRAYWREAAEFRQLVSGFGWQLSQRQQDRYLRKLKDGYTLILTDSDKVIQWASYSFERMTGYPVWKILGQKPSLLQGPATDSATTYRIRDRLNQARTVRADLRNYRKNGTVYTCRVTIDPLRNTQGDVTHFLAVEREVE